MGEPQKGSETCSLRWGWDGFDPVGREGAGRTTAGQGGSWSSQGRPLPPVLLMGKLRPRKGQRPHCTSASKSVAELGGALVPGFPHHSPCLPLTASLSSPTPAVRPQAASLALALANHCDLSCPSACKSFKTQIKVPPSGNLAACLQSLSVPNGRPTCSRFQLSRPIPSL